MMLDDLRRFARAIEEGSRIHMHPEDLPALYDAPTLFKLLSSTHDELDSHYYICGVPIVLDTSVERGRLIAVKL